MRVDEGAVFAEPRLRPVGIVDVRGDLCALALVQRRRRHLDERKAGGPGHEDLAKEGAVYAGDPVVRLQRGCGVVRREKYRVEPRRRVGWHRELAIVDDAAV